MKPSEPPHPSFGAGLAELPTSPDPHVSPCSLGSGAVWLKSLLGGPSVQCRSPILGNDLVELFPIRYDVKDCLGCRHGLRMLSA